MIIYKNKFYAMNLFYDSMLLAIILMMHDQSKFDCILLDEDMNMLIYLFRLHNNNIDKIIEHILAFDYSEHNVDIIDSIEVFNLINPANIYEGAALFIKLFGMIEIEPLTFVYSNLRNYLIQKYVNC